MQLALTLPALLALLICSVSGAVVGGGGRAVGDGARGRSLGPAWPYTPAGDDPGQREALMSLYRATSGEAWLVANTTTAAAAPWGTANVSYCR
jgi:hypothetical protein